VGGLGEEGDAGGEESLGVDEEGWSHLMAACRFSITWFLGAEGRSKGRRSWARGTAGLRDWEVERRASDVEGEERKREGE